MTFSRLSENERPIDVHVDGERVRVLFEGGLEISVPISYSQRLERATPEQRKRWSLIGRGEGIHWPDVDEDLSIRGLFQTYREKPATRVEQIPALVSDLMKTTGRLNRLFPDKPFTPDGHLVGSIGEVVAEYIYDLRLEPCSTPQVDARTQEGRSVQIKLTGKSSYAFRWPLREGEETPEILIALRLTERGFDEVYNGGFPTELLQKKSVQRNGQVSISSSALRLLRPSTPIPRVRTLENINRWFTPELAEVA